MDEILLKHFSPISLQEMDQVKLLNRIDKKFCLPSRELVNILYQIKNDYRMLNISGEYIQTYQTIYYDTERNEMYLSHHNGKLNRIKIRKRTYVNSQLTFLEVKYKTNKGRTIKKRLPTFNSSFVLNPIEQEFIHYHTPFRAHQIFAVMENRFKRLTLVSRSMDERCTVDTELQFHLPNRSGQLSDLAIIELKTNGRGSHSPLSQYLREHRVRETGFSKYCLGRALLDKNLKQNNFKEKLGKLNIFMTEMLQTDYLYATGGR